MLEQTPLWMETKARRSQVVEPTYEQRLLPDIGLGMASVPLVTSQRADCQLCFRTHFSKSAVSNKSGGWTILLLQHLIDVNFAACGTFNVDFSLSAPSQRVDSGALFQLSFKWKR